MICPVACCGISIDLDRSTHGEACGDEAACQAPATCEQIYRDTFAALPRHPLLLCQTALHRKIPAIKVFPDMRSIAPRGSEMTLRYRLLPREEPRVRSFFRACRGRGRVYRAPAFRSPIGVQSLHLDRTLDLRNSSFDNQTKFPCT